MSVAKGPGYNQGAAAAARAARRPPPRKAPSRSTFPCAPPPTAAAGPVWPLRSPVISLHSNHLGCRSCSELQAKLDTLRQRQFPVDGFLLDLQWFGGIPDVTGRCRMGSLDFDDPNACTDPEERIAAPERDGHGGVIWIEEA